METIYTTFMDHHISVMIDDPAIASEMKENGNKLYEGAMLEWIYKNIPHGGTMLDCGSNVGNHALAFSFMAGKVIAIEPVMHNYELLIQNILTNHRGNIIPLNIGMGVAPEFGYISKEPHMRWSECEIQLLKNSNNQIRFMRLEENKAVGGVVPVLSIDDLRLENVTLIKVDCEGMEFDVIEGALRTIKRCKPELFIETFLLKTRREIDEMLKPLGYEMIECYNYAPTYHYSASGKYPVTYTKPVATHFYKDITGWCDFEEIYKMMVAEAQDYDVFIEVGTANGQSAAFMAVEIFNCDKIIDFHTCDIFDGENNENQESYAHGQLRRFPFCQVHKMTGLELLTSNDVSNEERNYFVFLDGAHDERTLNDELHTCWNLRINVIAGHDYLNDAFPDVKATVDKFSKIVGVIPEIIGTSFLFRHNNPLIP